MSTRCIIAYRDDSIEDFDKVIWTYCHFDGYPSGVGKVLLEHYNSPELAKRVVSNGNINSLDAPELTKMEDNEYHEMPYKTFNEMNFPWVDYVYLYWKNLWIVRPTFGYFLNDIAVENNWEVY